MYYSVHSENAILLYCTQCTHFYAVEEGGCNPGTWSYTGQSCSQQDNTVVDDARAGQSVHVNTL